MSTPPGTGAPGSGDEWAAPSFEELRKILREQSKAVDDQEDSSGVDDKKEASTYLEIHRIAEDQRHRHREAMTPALRNIAQGWIIAVVMILIWQGFGSKIGFFHLADSVLVTLLTTTTVNILGLFWISLNYLYARQERAVQSTTLARSTKTPPAAPKLSTK